MNESMKVTVFLELFADIANCDMTGAYTDAIRKFSTSDPVSLYLSWSPQAIPDKGEEISLYSCSGELSEIVVGDKTYGFSDGQITVYVRVKPKNKDGYDIFLFDNQNCHELAGIGALCEDAKTSVATALEQAGLEGFD